MKTVGIILTILGAILIVLFFVFGFADNPQRGNELFWANTWSPIFGSFLFFAGVAVLMSFRKKPRNPQ
ncbi:hypothetical protein AB9P05_18855 [Roseivirga sp. BDSF3-8]|uniref:hypothetical protein n=1 Tax=Roseivirga sp. BDSF3-8 TaxID=3241598 RepID=UPI0035318982